MTGSAWLAAICLILLVVVINVSLLVGLRNRSTHQQFDLLARAARRLQRPWEEENRQLDELSRRVADLKKQPGEAEKQGESKDHP